MRETGCKAYFVGEDENEYELEYLEDDYGDPYVHVGLLRNVVKSIRNSTMDKEEAFKELDSILYDVEQSYL